MDRISSEDRDLLIDLERGRITSEEGTHHGPVSGSRQVKNLFSSAVSGLLGSNGSVGGECTDNSYGNMGEPSELEAENVEVLVGMNSEGEESGEHMALVEKTQVKEKRKKTNYKKASKPPRPPKGPSLDAADLKLVREISVIAMKKRARSERVKALKKMKEAKSSSSSSSSSSLSNSSLSAMVITILFFLVILFQGFCSRGSSSVSFQGSPEPAAATNSLISVQFYGNLATNVGSGPSSESPSSVEQASGSKFRSPG